MMPIRSFILLLCAGAGAAIGAEASPRADYNRGVESLEKKLLRDAESWLLRSLAAQKQPLQPPALYNLGHVRFQQGSELLEGEPPREPILGRGESATDDADGALSRADRALQTGDLMAIIEAYLSGRISRKELRLANEDVQRALDLYGSVLVRWRRSLGDFRSSDELKPDDDSKFNARVVERRIEELLKKAKELEELREALGQMRAELKEKLAELRSKIPDGMLPRGQGDDEEEDEDQSQPTPESGWQDQAGREGERRGITPEMAQQILEALGLTGDRKLPLGEGEKQPPRDPNAKDW
jgi:tetratricopeptide (TPR) repeat protein